MARGSPGRSGKVPVALIAPQTDPALVKQVRSTSLHSRAHSDSVPNFCCPRHESRSPVARLLRSPSTLRKTTLGPETHTHVAYPWYTVRDASNENHEPVAVGIGLLRLLSDASATYLPTWHVLRRSTPFRGEPIRARQTPEFSPSRTLLVAGLVEPFRGGLASARARALALGPSSSPGVTERQRCDGRDAHDRETGRHPSSAV